jgi:hypothetical protein
VVDPLEVVAPPELPLAPLELEVPVVRPLVVEVLAPVVPSVVPPEVVAALPASATPASEDWQV